MVVVVVVVFGSNQTDAGAVAAPALTAAIVAEICEGWKPAITVCNSLNASVTTGAKRSSARASAMACAVAGVERLRAMFARVFKTANDFGFIF